MNLRSKQNQDDQRPHAIVRPFALLGCFLLAAACHPGDDIDHCAEGEPGYACPVAGTGTYGFNGDGLPGQASDMYLVSQARRGPDGLLYLMDFNNHRLRVLDEDDGVMRTIAGNGFHGFAFTGVPAPDSPLENPIDFAFLPDGRVVFVSYHDPRILVLEEDGTLRAIAGTGDLGEVGNEGDDGPALSARFIQLDGIAVGPDGAIYVSDSVAHRIRVVRGGIVTTVAGTGERGYSGDGGPATAAALHWPTALAFGPEGHLYFTDSNNHVVRRIAEDGTIETIAGTGSEGFAGDEGPASQAELNQPNGVDVAEDGTVYIADRSNFRIRRIDPAGRIDTIAGSEKGYQGDGELAIDAEFGFLARVTIDGDSLLVADQGNSCVRRVHLVADQVAQ